MSSGREESEPPALEISGEKEKKEKDGEDAKKNKSPDKLLTADSSRDNEKPVIHQSQFGQGNIEVLGGGNDKLPADHQSDISKNPHRLSTKNSSPAGAKQETPQDTFSEENGLGTQGSDPKSTSKSEQGKETKSQTKVIQDTFGLKSVLVQSDIFNNSHRLSTKNSSPAGAKQETPQDTFSENGLGTQGSDPKSTSKSEQGKETKSQTKVIQDTFGLKSVLVQSDISNNSHRLSTKNSSPAGAKQETPQDTFSEENGLGTQGSDPKSTSKSEQGKETKSQTKVIQDTFGLKSVLVQSDISNNSHRSSTKNSSPAGAKQETPTFKEENEFQGSDHKSTSKHEQGRKRE